MTATGLLRVRNWDAHYEINRTRVLKRMLWLPLPNRLDNDGYIELVSHQNGAAHFGAWIGTVQVASRCKPRGTLMRDDGTPHTVESLARITRIPAGVFEEAVPRLLSIGWLELIQGDSALARVSADIPHEPAEIAHHDASTTAASCALPVATYIHTDRNTDTQECPAWNPESAFEELWTAYPAKGRVKRPLAQQYFCEYIRTPEDFRAVLEAVKGKWAHSETWGKGFIMALPEWIHLERWKEDPEPAGKQPSAAGGPVYRRWEPPKATPEQAADTEAWLSDLKDEHRKPGTAVVS
jgi:hypothetical protein